MSGRMSLSTMSTQCRLIVLSRHCFRAVPTERIINRSGQSAILMRLQNYATQSEKKDSKTGRELDIKRESPYAGLTFGEKVKEAGKDVTYTGFIIAGIAVLGTMGYFIGRELFSSESPSGVYGRALKLCKKNTEIIDSLGEPIKGYGETTRRGRRRHVSHMEYMSGEQKHMRMKFYLEGTHRKGTVHLDVYKNEAGKYEYRYLFVELDGYPQRTIVLEDRR